MDRALRLSACTQDLFSQFSSTRAKRMPILPGDSRRISRWKRSLVSRLPVSRQGLRMPPLPVNPEMAVNLSTTSMPVHATLVSSGPIITYLFQVAKPIELYTVIAVAYGSTVNFGGHEPIPYGFVEIILRPSTWKTVRERSNNIVHWKHEHVGQICNSCFVHLILFRSGTRLSEKGPVA